MTYKPDWRKWHTAGFGGELLPIIPIDAKLMEGSKVSPENRGKVPGVLREDGTWAGLGGKWAETVFPRAPKLQEWQGWGAGIGMQGRRFVAIDIDVNNEQTARAIQDLALEHIGSAPIRWRKGSPRRLLPYRVAEGLVIRKRRIAFRSDDADHGLDVLGYGQYYNIDGLHPSGERYRWSEEFTASSLTETTEEKLNKFMVAVIEYIEMIGGELLAQKGGGTGSSSGRKPLSDTSLHAPNAQLVLDVLAAVPCNDETFQTRDDFVLALAAIKAALGGDAEEYWPNVLEWALQYPGAEDDYIEKIWVSISDAAVGWEYLSAWARGHGFSGDAQADFDDRSQPDATDKESRPQPDTAIERALDRYIWCGTLERFYDEKTGLKMTTNAFNAANVGVADYGRSGVQSAAAIFQNMDGARKVDTATYRVGEPLIVHEGGAQALNLWRPSDFKPASSASNNDVRPWLDHMELIFGALDSQAMQHILNVMAFWTQKQGHKINHAIVIYGATQGTGKDTCFVPLVRFFGDHNVANIQPEAVTGQFNDFLCKQIAFVNEMINFEKRATMNRMKPWLAVPQYTITVNMKFAQPFTIPNAINWVIFTNYPDAISLDDTDRRFWVHECLLTMPKSPAYYEALYKFYDHGGAEKVIAWLLQRDISSFNPKAPPPLTQAKQDMIDHAMPKGARRLAGLLAEGEAFHGRDLITTREILGHARTVEGIHDASERSATAVLRRATFAPLPKRVKLPDGTVVTLWARAGSGAAQGAFSHGRLVDEYAAEIKRTGGALKA